MVTHTIDKPVYCRDCNSRNTFIKHDQLNVLTDKNDVFEQCFKCKVCNHLTWWNTKHK